MSTRQRLTIAVAALILASASAASAQFRISGTATYRERIALPMGALFEATLEDVSRADARAEVLGQVKLDRLGAPPFSFAIDYDVSRIHVGGRYVVRARITRGTDLLFTTTQAYPVLTGGAGSTVSLLLVRTSSSSPAQTAPAPTTQAVSLAAGVEPLPASFEGNLPCADCPGIRLHLDLYANETFLMRTVYRDRPPVPDTIGRWVRSSDRQILRLERGSDQPMLLGVRDGGGLATLDIDGQPIVTPFNTTLARLPRFTPVRAAVRARDPRIPHPPLVGPTWRLLRLAGRGADVVDLARRPTLTLSSGRVSGSTGCNRVSGSYTLKGDTLTLPALVSTRMACVAGVDLETPYLSALGKTAKFRMVGNWLELLDAEGAMAARFEAVSGS